MDNLGRAGLSVGFRSLGAALCTIGLVIQPAPAGQSFEPRDVGPILRIDAREFPPGEVLDLSAMAREGGLEEAALSLRSVRQRVSVLEVLDAHILRLKTSRGEEVVRLDRVHGSHPLLPAEVNSFIRETAIPAIDRYLREGHELVERAPRRSIWEFHDAEGRRVVDLQLHDSVGTWHSVAEQIYRRGWGCSAPVFESDESIDSYQLLGPADLPDAGLRELPAWRAFTARILARCEEVLTLTDQELTQRARDVQGQVAALLGWEPKVAIRAEWVMPHEAKAMFLAQFQQSLEDDPDGGGALTVEESEKMAEGRAAGSVAWSPEGPIVYVMHRPSGFLAGLDLLDELLAHEIAHQYQEEVLGENVDVGRDEPRPPTLPWEGHAGWLTQMWLDDQESGRTHSAHEFQLMEFRMLVHKTGKAPDDLVEWFRRSGPSPIDLDKLRTGRSVLRDYVVYTQPVVRFTPTADARHPILRLYNPTRKTLSGLYGGMWYTLPWRQVGPEAVEGINASPPFHLVLPPGSSINVKLSRGLSMSTGVGSVIRGNWSPTPQS